MHNHQNDGSPKKVETNMVVEVVQMGLAVGVFITGALLFGMTRSVRQ